MYCRSVLLLLSLFVAVVTSQNAQACTDAENALLDNQPCTNAFLGVVDALNQSTTIGGEVDINVYCAADCRNLIKRALVACDDDDDPDGAEGFAITTRFICATDADRNESCFNFLTSPQFEALIDAVETSGVCSDELPGQMCSPACQTAFQNAVIDGGCCIPLLFDVANQFANEELTNLVAQCPVDLSRGGTCTEIGGGAAGLKELGSVLLFTIIIAVQAVI